MDITGAGKLLRALRAGECRPTRMETPVPELGCTLVRGPGGHEVAIFHGDSVQTRKERWPRRLLGGGLQREWPGPERWSKAQRQAYDVLVGEVRNALLYGPTGRGKTMVALAALRELYVVRGMSALALQYAEFKRRLEPSWLGAHDAREHDLLEQWSAPAVLLLDDVGYGDSEHRATGHEKRLLLELVQAREAGGRHTWITTNLDTRQINTYGEAAISRVREQAHVLRFATRNYRLPASEGAA